MVHRRRFGATDIDLSVIGFGAFKIGRNAGAKYPDAYDLPDDAAVERLLHTVLDLGITYIDTAPAYGESEVRIGRAIGARRDEFVLSSKVGETFADGRSTFDFHADAVRASVHRSLERLRTDHLDIVFVHSSGDDLSIQRNTDVVPTLQALRDEGLVRAVGFSGKTIEGAEAALAWADGLMVTYHAEDRSHASVIETAAAAGRGVVVKKGLASGHLDPATSIEFVLGTAGVTSLVIGGLNPDHLRSNLATAASVVGPV